MVIRPDRRRLRRALILALFLLVPTLLSDLSLFSRTGHGGGPGSPAPALSGTLALLPLDRGALHPGAGGKHRHAGTAGGDAGSADEADLLQNLVYLTHANQVGGGNEPLSDGGPNGDHGWSFGGGGHGAGSGGSGSGGGGFGGAPFGSPGGNDPAPEFLPFDAGTGPGDTEGGKDGGDRPFLSPPLAPSIPSLAAVPEPATWALFILGFGLIGARLRHARDMRLAPALTRARGKRLG